MPFTGGTEEKQTVITARRAGVVVEVLLSKGLLSEAWDLVLAK